jgi:putative glycerol-1-phosphate prenyltransferase
MTIYSEILAKIDENRAYYLILLDPDRFHGKDLDEFAYKCSSAGVDGFLVGGSLMVSGDFDGAINKLKEITHLPVIIFPGALSQISPNADAILFISNISGRNAEHLIGKHVIAAPLLKKYNLEAISTGYMLIESGRKTTAEYMSGSMPIPRHKSEIAVATALAAEYLGMKLVYLEAGSGADNHVPFEMVRAVANNVSIPVIVGGGIKTPEVASKMVDSGAKIIVTGNYFEDKQNWNKLREFVDAVKGRV